MTTSNVSASVITDGVEESPNWRSKSALEPVGLSVVGEDETLNDWNRLAEHADDVYKLSVQGSETLDGAGISKDSNLTAITDVYDYGSYRSNRRVLASLRPQQNAKTYLNGDRLRIAYGIEGIVRDLSLTQGVDISSVYITTRRFPEKQVELKFTISTNMNSEQAFAFWDALGDRIDSWSHRLPTRIRRLLDERTAISVEWTDPYADRTE
jgi:hypothetical protein